MKLATELRLYSVYLDWVRGHTEAAIAKNIGRSERTVKRWISQAAVILADELMFITHRTRTECIALALNRHHFHEEFRAKVSAAVRCRLAGIPESRLDEIVDLPEQVKELTRVLAKMEKEK